MRRHRRQYIILLQKSSIHATAAMLRSGNVGSIFSIVVSRRVRHIIDFPPVDHSQGPKQAPAQGRVLVAPALLLMTCGIKTCSSRDRSPKQYGEDNLH